MFNREYIQMFDRRMFLENVPIPWYGFEGMLAQDKFEKLCREFPSLDLFEHHVGMARLGNQRPHNRLYLALDESVYRRGEKVPSGCIERTKLGSAWREFVEAIENNADYHTLVKELLGTRSYRMRFAWHCAQRGDDVSPHVDAGNKLGTHLFYFNTSETWNRDWGGETLFLEGKNSEGDNPEIRDFKTVYSSEIFENRSCLFRNTPNAWHGVASLNCPEGYYRRLFTVVFEIPASQPRRGLRSWVVRGIRHIAGKQTT